jgi:hypothetical protein
LLTISSSAALADFQVDSAAAYPAVCRSENGYVVAWESGDGSDKDILFESFDSDGDPGAGSQRANQTTTASQQLPDIACRPDGGFLIVWESREQDGDGLGIFGRSFDGDGDPLGPEFQINSHTTDNQRNPRACVGSGVATIVWDSFGQDGDAAGIYAQRYDAGGAPLGTEMQVNSFATSNQRNPAVACAADGRHVVVWQSAMQDGDGDGIFGRFYAADGSAAGAEFQMNVGTYDHQRHPNIAIAPNGTIAVVWESAESGTEDMIVARIFDQDRAREIVVSADTSHRNEAPQITFANDQEYFVTWAAGAGYDFDIHGLRFLTAQGPLGEAAQLNATAAGNQGPLGTSGRGIALASHTGGDFVAWQSHDLPAAPGSSAVLARRFAPCTGDCRRDGRVTIDELIQGVRIALGELALSTCEAFDRDGDDVVGINEIVAAVAAALGSQCPAPVT